MNFNEALTGIVFFCAVRTIFQFGDISESDGEKSDDFKFVDRIVQESEENVRKGISYRNHLTKSKPVSA